MGVAAISSLLSAALSREVLGRQHRVDIDVPPTLVEFSQSIGLATARMDAERHNYKPFCETSAESGVDQVGARILGARYPAPGADDDGDFTRGRGRPLLLSFAEEAEWKS